MRITVTYMVTVMLFHALQAMQHPENYLDFRCPPCVLHCPPMEPVDTEIIEKIVALSGQLPDEQRRQLLDLVANWKTDIRQAVRETYTELLNFTSTTGTHYGHARDISATGVFIATPAQFELGEKIKLILTFISAPNPVRLQGSIVRKTDEGIGVHFDDASRNQVKELDSIISKHALILHHK